ncbi:MAG: endolytic transglycosylase MltG [Spirochaetales bacterium]|nr:endolytic transglycosylase MltG [Spirochaetales bacterium]
MKRGLIVILLALGIIFLLGLGGLFYGYYLNTPLEGMPEEGTLFTVSKGQTMADVAVSLKEQGLIRSEFLFRLIGKVYGTGGKLKAGLYRVDSGLSTMAIHNILVSGNQILFKITIPEGWTARMVAELLEKNGITDSGDFLKALSSDVVNRVLGIPDVSAEGFLFPDTYYFPLDYPAERVLEHLVKTFQAVLEEVSPDWQSLDAETLYHRVILASIVEREYRDPEEAALMASVFYNRLDLGMTLGSCATVVYALTEEMGRSHPSRLTYADLEVESAYNTYRNPGLPPGPIANPGYIALQAAFNPVESDYLYFVLQDPEAGRHYFSKNLGEHNQAYTLYIKNTR